MIQSHATSVFWDGFTLFLLRKGGSWSPFMRIFVVLFPFNDLISRFISSESAPPGQPERHRRVCLTAESLSQLPQTATGVLSGCFADFLSMSLGYILIWNASLKDEVIEHESVKQQGSQTESYIVINTLSLAWNCSWSGFKSISGSPFQNSHATINVWRLRI